MDKKDGDFTSLEDGGGYSDFDHEDGTLDDLDDGFDDMAVKLIGTAVATERASTIKMAVPMIGMPALDLTNTMALPTTVLNTSRPPRPLYTLLPVAPLFY